MKPPGQRGPDRAIGAAANTITEASTRKRTDRAKGSAAQRRISALIAVGAHREAARVAAEREWVTHRAVESLLREKPYAGRWSA